jgi:DNA-binding MarR family transcriptional regulator
MRTAAEEHTRIVLDALRNIVRSLRLAASESQMRVGLSTAQLFALQNLADGVPISLGELAYRTATDPSSVSVVVSRLVASWLIVRKRALDDGRRLEISISRAGRTVLRGAPTAVQHQLIAVIERFAPTARAELARYLSRIARELGAPSGPAQMLLEEDDVPRRRGDKATEAAHGGKGDKDRGASEQRPPPRRSMARARSRRQP